MKTITKTLSALIFLCMAFIIFATMSAGASELDTIVSLQIDNPIMQINGTSSEIDAGLGTKPVITNGRTLVPVRAIIEAFGGSVGWDGSTRTVTLSLKNDTIRLVIDSPVAYLNGKSSELDVSPTVINGRTMLPIRFIAEGFNLGVAWQKDTRTVFIIRNDFNTYEEQQLLKTIPVYNGCAYVSVNGNKPFFKDYELIDASFEFYAGLDEFGRCDVAYASVGTDIMPTDERKSISSVTPTGWINNSYDFIDGGYLYNRCHLIGFQLTGENANNRNLITGTRYLNIDGMLPFENMIDDYVEKTGNNVLYRSTPIFNGSNLLADGVLLEAYSVEDNGAGISFCIYCYNVQPNVHIDYATGANSSLYHAPSQTPSQGQSTGTHLSVYRTPTGRRYHYDAQCGGKNSYTVSMEDALGAGLTPCQKCVE